MIDDMEDTPIILHYKERVAGITHYGVISGDDPDVSVDAIVAPGKFEPGSDDVPAWLITRDLIYKKDPWGPVTMIFHTPTDLIRSCWVVDVDHDEIRANVGPGLGNFLNG